MFLRNDDDDWVKNVVLQRLRRRDKEVGLGKDGER